MEPIRKLKANQKKMELETDFQLYTCHQKSLGSFQQDTSLSPTPGTTNSEGIHIYIFLTPNIHTGDSDVYQWLEAMG